MRLIKYLSCLMLVVLTLGITSCDNQNVEQFDGVYDAYPFNACHCDGEVYLLIDNGNMQIYGPHGILHEVGRVEQDRWRIWPDGDVILKRLHNSLTMQTVGKDTFYEFPLLPMTKNEFHNLESSKTEGIDEYVAFLEEPFKNTYGSDRFWKLRRRCGPGATLIIDHLLKSEVVISGNVIHVRVSPKYDKPIRAVFDPTNFYGRVVIVGTTNKSVILEIEPYPDTPLPELIVIEPGDTFNYSIDLELELRFDYNLVPGNTIITELHIEMPHARIMSDPVTVK